MLKKLRECKHIDDLLLLCNQCNEIIYAQMRACITLDIETVEVRNKIIKHLMETQNLTTIVCVN